MRDTKRLVREGKIILRKLNSADKNLKRARRLGIWDIFGGKGLVGYIKHKNIDRAERKLRDLKWDILNFQKQANGYNDVYVDIDLNLGYFNKFMDIFVDHQLANFYTQSRIKEARRSVKKLKKSIKRTLRSLRRL